MIILLFLQSSFKFLSFTQKTALKEDFFKQNYAKYHKISFLIEKAILYAFFIILILNFQLIYAKKSSQNINLLFNNDVNIITFAINVLKYNLMNYFFIFEILKSAKFIYVNELLFIYKYNIFYIINLINYTKIQFHLNRFIIFCICLYIDNLLDEKNSSILLLLFLDTILVPIIKNDYNNEALSDKNEKYNNKILRDKSQKYNNENFKFLSNLRDYIIISLYILSGIAVIFTFQTKIMPYILQTIEQLKYIELLSCIYATVLVYINFLIHFDKNYLNKEILSKIYNFIHLVFLFFWIMLLTIKFNLVSKFISSFAVILLLFSINLIIKTKNNILIKNKLIQIINYLIAFIILNILSFIS